VSNYQDRNTPPAAVNWGSAPALVQPRHRLGCYTVGSSRFTYDVHDPESKREAHQAAVAEMHRQNGGRDPLAERIAATAFARQFEGQAPHKTDGVAR
jgi:hypothetical protein